MRDEERVVRVVLVELLVAARPLLPLGAVVEVLARDLADILRGLAVDLGLHVARVAGRVERGRRAVEGQALLGLERCVGDIERTAHGTRLGVGAGAERGDGQDHGHDVSVDHEGSSSESVLNIAEFSINVKSSAGSLHVEALTEECG